MIRMTANIQKVSLKYNTHKWKSIRPTSIKLMILILDKIKYAQNRSIKLDIKKICDLTSMSGSSIRNGIAMLIDLGIIKSISELLIKENLINESKTIKKTLFDHIILYEPFIEYLHLFSKLGSGKKAAEQLKIVFEVRSSSNVIVNTFNGWIKKLNIKIENKESNILSDLQKEIDDSSGAIIKLRKIYNKDLKSLPNLVVSDLIDAITQVDIDPSNSLTDCGRALENFLRLRFSSSIDLSKCNGISQITDKLRQFKKINGKIINILKGLGALRSMGDSHGLDKEDKKIWEISKESAIISYYLTIKTMSSIESYNNGVLEF